MVKPLPVMMRKALHTYALWNGQVQCSLCWVRRQKCPLEWLSNGPSIIVKQLSVLLVQAPIEPIRAGPLGNVPNIMGKVKTIP
jgi:hypothetical protein